MLHPEKKFGRHLRALIKLRGYRTLELFGHENQFEKGYVAKLVRGEVNPKLTNLIRLARSLDVTLDDLYPMKKRRK